VIEIDNQCYLVFVYEHATSTVRLGTGFSSTNFGMEFDSRWRRIKLSGKSEDYKEGVETYDDSFLWDMPFEVALTKEENIWATTAIVLGVVATIAGSVYLIREFCA